MLVGGFTFGLIVGSLADVVQKSDPGATARVELLGKIHAFLHENHVRVPPSLLFSSTDFYRHVLGWLVQSMRASLASSFSSTETDMFWLLSLQVPGKLTRVIRTYFSNLYDLQSLFDERTMIFEPLPMKYREVGSTTATWPMRFFSSGRFLPHPHPQHQHTHPPLHTHTPPARL